MLVDFRVRNFRSFQTEECLSLLASRRLGDEHAAHWLRLPGSEERLLRAAVIWGANGSGKSNLCAAMRFAADLILEGTHPEQEIRYQPFALAEASLGEPTAFEFRFLVDEEIFSYGFAADRCEIHEEWLTLHDGGRERVVFERVGRAEVTAGPVLKASHDKVLALIQVGVRPNQLFLTAIRESIPGPLQGTMTRKAIRWFEDRLVFIGPTDRYSRLAEILRGDSGFREFAGRFLEGADTGVRGLRVEETDVEERAVASGIGGRDEAALRAALGLGRPVRKLGPDGTVIVAEGEKGAKMLRIEATHGTQEGGVARLPLREESDGTRRLLDLLPALYAATRDSQVYVIDELDRSLHPNLAWEFVNFFLTVCRGHGRQMIVTTHEDRLLDLDLLRRDEMWFVEKGPDGASRLRSLADFRVRKDLRIDKGYLDGRFGGVPRFGPLWDLVPEDGGQTDTTAQRVAEAGS